MNTDQVEDMHRARGSLGRQRDLLTKRIGGIEWRQFLWPKI